MIGPSSVAALRALLRAEWRQIRRNPGRAVLLLTLVATPVAAVVGASTLARIIEPTAHERAAAELGQAALRIDGAAPADHARIAAMLPDTARIERVFVGVDLVRTPGRVLRGRLIAIESDSAAPLADGLYRVARGRVPRNAGEVALSPILLRGHACDLGDTVTLAYGPTRTITGVVVDPEDTEAPLVVRTRSHVERGGNAALLIGLDPADAATTAAALRRADLAVRTRREAGGPSGGLADILFVLGSIGFVEAALVVAAAFAVTLRRRQFEFGLLAASGAAPGDMLLAILILTGGLALVASVAGALLGVGGAALVHPWLDGWNGRRNGPFEVAWPHLSGAVSLGTVIAVLAAAPAAWAAAHRPIRVSLGARRPAARRPGRWLAAGVTLLVIGITLLALAPRTSGVVQGLAVTLGPLLGVFGIGACSGTLLLALARRATHLPLAWRLAVRDAGRFHARNGPVVTAIVAGMAMSVTAAILVASIERTVAVFPRAMRSDQVIIRGPDAERVAARIAAEHALRAAAPLRAAYVGGEPLRASIGEASADSRGAWVACGDRALLVALGGEAAADAFDAGHLLYLAPEPPADQVVLRAWVSGVPLETPPVTHVPVTEVVREPRFLLRATAIVPRGIEAGPPLNRSTVPQLIRFDRPVSAALLDALRPLAGDAVRTEIDAARLHGSPSRSAYYAAFALCLLTGLIVVVVATLLSDEESRADRRTLDAIGAPPPLLRTHRAAYAAYLALLGCVLAIPAGALPASGLIAAANLALPFVVPWGDLVLIAFGLPALTFAGMWLVSRPRLQDARLLEHRR